MHPGPYDAGCLGIASDDPYNVPYDAAARSCNQRTREKIFKIAILYRTKEQPKAATRGPVNKYPTSQSAHTMLDVCVWHLMTHTVYRTKEQPKAATRGPVNKYPTSQSASHYGAAFLGIASDDPYNVPYEAAARSGNQGTREEIFKIAICNLAPEIKNHWSTCIQAPTMLDVWAHTMLDVCVWHLMTHTVYRTKEQPKAATRGPVNKYPTSQSDVLYQRAARRGNQGTREEIFKIAICKLAPEIENHWSTCIQAPTMLDVWVWHLMTHTIYRTKEQPKPATRGPVKKYPTSQSASPYDAGVLGIASDHP
ncbi:hypothetical protein DFH07DRAFT_785721 [Mycena maculata]|uniref:Uncharacterized protein n=1 Tax=Mycena maculata TaxID=230809 RepID=A0AAD7H907_9AGAR|nr:hypothetical protein DFH07DRAFT_785721 [Mycena maculata]